MALRPRDLDLVMSPRDDQGVPVAAAQDPGALQIQPGGSGEQDVGRVRKDPTIYIANVVKQY